MNWRSSAGLLAPQLSCQTASPAAPPASPPRAVSAPSAPLAPPPPEPTPQPAHEGKECNNDKETLYGVQYNTP
ncbi:hypothetical protein JYU34_012821 [Plutella xylostella]|uniref:Uncharacterized protein n=1 Tax=Plutella xylostella TaxID=51655 RepID=A0ABQ7QC80_PLUXY|nr:hypothetical protein JYU34_012821 [Plutella xylostella]